jgi:hypothetical protein
MPIFLDPKLFNYVLVILYAANASRWALHGSWVDAAYWLGALIITIAVTWGVCAMKPRETPATVHRRPIASLSHREPRLGSKSHAVIQQAKTAAGGSRFLQIVATPRRATHKPEPKLTRVVFRISRLMEFCSMRELQNQTGHSVYDWPLVILKELMDNGLDSCEEAEVAPVISITVKRDSITIKDNGGGIKTNVIKSILDYTVRVSSREAYVSPTRGAQGNALKTVLAMDYVLDRTNCNEADAVGMNDHRNPRNQAHHRVWRRSY